MICVGLAPDAGRLGRFGPRPPTHQPTCCRHPTSECFASFPHPAPPTAAALGWLQVELRAQDLTWQRFLDGAPPPPPASLPAHVADAEEITNAIFSSGTTGQPAAFDLLTVDALCQGRSPLQATGVCASRSRHTRYLPAMPRLPASPPACPPACLPAGEPKAIPWTHITPMRAATDAFFHQDVRQGDVLCWPTNMGWMMGPWLVYAGKQLPPDMQCLPASKPKPSTIQQCAAAKGPAALAGSH